MGTSKLKSQKTENGFLRSGNYPKSAGLPAARRLPHVPSPIWSRYVCFLSDKMGGGIPFRVCI